MDGDGGVGGAGEGRVEFGVARGVQSIDPTLPSCIFGFGVELAASTGTPAEATSTENRRTCLPTVPLRTGTMRDGAGAAGLATGGGGRGRVERVVAVGREGASGVEVEAEGKGEVLGEDGAGGCWKKETKSDTRRVGVVGGAMLVGRYS